MKSRFLRHCRETSLGGFLTAPLIYGLSVPFVLMDLLVTIYQQICFRVYGIATVKRSDHIIIDRDHLPHMTFRERLNCGYCDYAQGVLAYVGEVVSRTEHFWCPVKHGLKVVRHEPPRYEGYIENNDTAGFKGKLRRQRDKCRACETGCEKS